MDNQSQQLPAKENTLFKQVVKFYETKHYKKGIKAADQVLPLPALAAEKKAVECPAALTIMPGCPLPLVDVLKEPFESNNLMLHCRF